MIYTSNPLPLEFWIRLQTRIEAEFAASRARLPELLAPSPVTIDSGELAIQHVTQNRQEFFARLSELESMQMLLMVLGGQVRIAMFRADIMTVEAHIACLRNVAEVFTEFMSNRPRRIPVEQELLAALQQYNALRSSGNNETVQAERQRLRAFTRDLQVLGAEDIYEYERVLRTLHSNIDQKEAELQNLKVTTLMQLSVPDNLEALVASFGVELFSNEPALLQAPEGTDSAALEGPQATDAE